MTRRILLVENDEGNALVMRLLCELAGFEVVWAPDGPSGLEALGRESVDMVLMDLCMPGMDGLTLYRRLRQDPALMHMPVLVVTAFPTHPELPELARTPHCAVVIKPFQGHDLVEAVRRHLDQGARPSL